MATTKTLKLTTGSVKAALRRAGVALAEFQEWSGRCTASGAEVTTWSHGFAHGKVQPVAHVRWATKHAYSMTEASLQAARTQRDNGAIAVSTALTLAGYRVSSKIEDFAIVVVVTLP